MGRKGIIIDDDDAVIFKKATNSQYSSTLYKQLKRDKRLDRFKVALQVCGARGLSLSDTCKYISKLFPSYVRGKGLLPKTLGDMISFYPDLEEAYGFCTDIGEMVAYNRAMVLAETTEDINDIKTFNEMYATGDMLYIREEKEDSGDKGNTGSTQINFFGSRNGSGVDE